MIIVKLKLIPLQFLGSRARMVVGFTTTYAIGHMPITTDVVSSNHTQGEVYNIMW